MSEPCYICGRPIPASGSKHQVCVKGEPTEHKYWVGPDCYKRVIAAGSAGYTHPSGGPPFVVCGKSKALVAVDLHGTIADKNDQHNGEYDPSAYELQPGAVEALQELRDDGHEVAIWTCWATEEARAWLDQHQVPYDYINEEAPDHGSPKIDADVYLDDKAVRHEGDWNRTLAEAYATGKLDKGLCVITRKALISEEEVRRLAQDEIRSAGMYTRDEIRNYGKTAHEVACPECGGGGCDFCNDSGSVRTADDKAKKLRYVGKSRTGGQVWYRS